MDIGIQEVFLISVIALIVLGPERLPIAIKTLALWIGRIKRSFNDIRADIERELDVDEIREQIHNETVLHELGESTDQLKKTVEQIQSGTNLASESSQHAEKSAGQ